MANIDYIEALERLARLKDRGVLTDAEFSIEKARLLGAVESKTTQERIEAKASESLLGDDRSLGGVDKFEPVSGGGEMDHAEEAVGQLIVPSGDGTVDLEVTEHALDAIALLIERPVVLDLHASV